LPPGSEGGENCGEVAVERFENAGEESFAREDSSVRPAVKGMDAEVVWAVGAGTDGNAGGGEPSR
jgi:hypothetical protein